MAKKPAEPIWLAAPEEHDFPAAQSYLSLIYKARKVDKLISKLKAAKSVTFKAKDIFRASGLPILGVSNSHVERDQRKIRRGVPISPLLLVRDRRNGKVVIADGYHRLCAVYAHDEDALIPCRIA